MKRMIAVLLCLALVLSLCACAPSTPAQVDTTTKFTSEGFTLSIPNEYADLLIVDTTVSAGNDGTFFSVREKASVEVSKKLWPDDETMVGGFLFGIGRVNETVFHDMMIWGMTGAEVFARDEEGNYYIYYHPTDVQLVRAEYTEADWEQWGDLCEWAADMDVTFLFENPSLLPYWRTYSDVDCFLHFVTYGDGSIQLTKKGGDAVYTPDLSDSMPYLEQLLDDVLFHTVQGGDIDLEGDYITLDASGMYRHSSFDFFIDEGQQQYIRLYQGLETSYFVASKNGEFFPAGQVMNDWLEALC